MRKIIFIILIMTLAMTIVVMAECITGENKAVKNGVNFPNFCYDSQTLLKNYCANDSVEQEYITCPDGTFCNTNSCEGQPTEKENKTEVCTPDFICDDWTACENGQQTRTCADTKLCRETENQRTETQACTVTETPKAEPESTNTGFLITVITIITVILIIVGLYLRKKDKIPNIPTGL